MLTNKVFWIIVVAVLIVLVSIMVRNRDDIILTGSTSSPTPTRTPASLTRTFSETDMAQQTKVYTDLVKEYAGRHIQFDINCQAIPTETTFKNGTSVMFDNRSGDVRTIKIGNTAHVLSGYGYKIITLASPILPATFSLGCGSAVNVGKILLQR